MAPSAPPLSLAAAIDHASALLASDPAAAARQAQAILDAAAGDPRAVLILASARRRLGDAAGARALLEPLARAYPGAAMTRYELGMALSASGDVSAARQSLRHAVQINRDLAVGWQALGDLLFADGDIAGAEAAYAEHERAAVSDPALKPAALALFDGRLDEAERLLRAHLTVRIDDIAGLHMLAQAVARLGRFMDAEILLERVLELDPAFDGARFAYADALFHQQKGAQALAQVEPLLEADPADPAYRNLAAACLGLVGEDARAIGLYESLLADYPKQPKVWLNYGHALRTVGRREEAVAAYKHCIALAPGLGDAYWSLANLKVASFSEAEVAGLTEALQQAGLSADDRLHMHYALGKALEDRADAPGAFENYAAGAAVRRAAGGYDPHRLTDHVGRSKALFTPAFFAERPGFGAASDAPIFVLGLPRSGSTLIEQILASHSQVEGTMELPDIGLIAARFGDRYPEALSDLDGAQAAALGEAFLQGAQVHRKRGRRLFVDKMPNNFQHIGLIQLILPHGKIIDARRHPLGSCFSAFKQHFAQGQAFSYDLTDLGLYYRDYFEMMAHVDAVLPGRVHRAIYEDVVEHTEVEIRRLLDHCGLAFEPACLSFYDNDRAVRTVSSEQVRRPIFRQGLDQWRAFEPWLEPLKEALGPALTAWRG